MHIFHAWRLVENDPKQKSPWWNDHYIKFFWKQSLSLFIRSLGMPNLSWKDQLRSSWILMVWRWSKLVNLKYVTLLSISIITKTHVKVTRLSKRITNWRSSWFSVTNFPYQQLKKCMENSIENMHIGVKSKGLIMINIHHWCSSAEAEKEEMRRKMKEELLAQMEFNQQNMMSWDEKVKSGLHVNMCSPCLP